MYGPYLTLAEIKAKYPNQWVLIGNPTTRGRSLAPTGGVVIFNCANHEVFHQWFEAWPDDPAIQHTAAWYTGNVGKRFGDVILDSETTEPGVA